MALLRRFWPVLLIVLAPLIPLWKAVFLGHTIGPFDQIRQMAPWNGPKPEQPWDVLQADGVLQFYPWRDLVLSSWSRFEPPFWNPYQLAGTPLLANSQSGGFYPLHILLGVLQVPTPLAITLLAWFHLSWAGLGVLFLVRKLGGTALGGAVGGLSFSLAAFLLGWVPLASVITTVSWIPWCLAFVVALYEPTADRRGNSALLGLSIGMLILGGHLQFVAYGLMAVVTCSLAMAVARVRLAPLLWSGLSVVVGVCLAAPQLHPVLNYSQYSHRRNVPSEEGYQAYLGSAVQFPEILSRLVNPFSQGNPTERADPSLPFSTFWPPHVQQGANWAESAATIGPLVLLLLCLLPLARPDWRRVSGVAAVTVLALALAGGTGLNRLLYFYAPGWSSTGSPSRVLVLFILGACTLAGLALDKPLWATSRRNLGIAFGVFVILAALSLRPTLPPAPEGFQPDAWQALVSIGNQTALPMTLLAIVLCVVVVGAALFSDDRRIRYAVAALPLVFAGMFFLQTVRTGDSSFLRPTRDRSYSRSAFDNEAWGLLSAAQALMPPNTASALRVHDLAGYDSLLHRDTVALLADANGGDPAPPANGNIMFIKPAADSSKLADAGVSARNGRDLEGDGRVTLSGGSAWIDGEGLSSVTIEVQGSGRLVLKDRNMPGWTATVDGRSVPIEGKVWREVDVPAGAKTVVMRYTPPGLGLGFYAFLPGATAIILLASNARRKRRLKVETKEEPEELPKAA